MHNSILYTINTENFNNTKIKDIYGTPILSYDYFIYPDSNGVNPNSGSGNSGSGNSGSGNSDSGDANTNDGGTSSGNSESNTNSEPTAADCLPEGVDFLTATADQMACWEERMSKQLAADLGGAAGGSGYSFSR